MWPEFQKKGEQLFGGELALPDTGEQLNSKVSDF